MRKRERSLKVGEAIKALSKPGSRLVLTNNDGRRDFCIFPGGSKVTEKSAEKILCLRVCRVCDSGLLPEVPQSWTLDI